MQTNSTRQPPRTALMIIVGCLAVLGVLSAVAHFLVPPYNPGFAEYPVVTATHVVLGALYLTLAPLQLVRRLRARVIGLHRWTGRVLVTIGVIVGLSALFLGLVVPFSGDPERIVIGMFGGLFLISLVLGYARVRQGRIAEHREWMLRAFAIGLSVATMRLLFIPALAIAGDPSDGQIAALSVAAFTVAFLVHATVAEWWIHRTRPLNHSQVNRRPVHELSPDPDLEHPREGANT